MKRWLVRSALVVAVLVVLATGGIAIWFWTLGDPLLKHAESDGWLAPVDATAPLTLLERTVAGAEFQTTWDKTAFPCRSVGRTLAIAQGDFQAGMPVSAMLAREIAWSQPTPERSIKAAFGQTSAACKLEMTYSDTELLRFWMRRVRVAGEVGMDAAARKLFGRNGSELDAWQSFKLAALLHDPRARTADDKWNKRAAYLQSHAPVWEGDRMLDRTVEQGE